MHSAWWWLTPRLQDRSHGWILIVLSPKCDEKAASTMTGSHSPSISVFLFPGTLGRAAPHACPASGSDDETRKGENEAISLAIERQVKVVSWIERLGRGAQGLRADTRDLEPDRLRQMSLFCVRPPSWSLLRARSSGMRRTSVCMATMYYTNWIRAIRKMNPQTRRLV